jgi:beta-carotene 15,15'-dioxygenase
LNKNQPYFYHILLLTLVLACHTLQRIFGFGLHSQIIFFLVIALSIGLFHGMLDIILLQNKPFQQQRFLLIYGALALGTCLLLALFSGAALIILLLLSVWHFGEIQGENQAKQPHIKRFILGTNALAAAFLLGGSDVAVILTTILNQSLWFNATWQLWRMLSVLWLVAFALYTLLLIVKQQLQTFYADLFEIVIVWLAFLLLPPLVAFSLYFGAYHALRHIRDVLPSKNVIKTHQIALLLTALASAWMLGCLVWLFSNNEAQITNIFSSQSMLQATIILLVAVTLPHAILISLWRKI